MKRIQMLDVAAGVSVAVCLAAVGMWVAGERSTRVLMRLGCGGQLWQVVSRGGWFAANNQPQVDWENLRRRELLGQVRSAEKLKMDAAEEFQAHWLELHNGERAGMEFVTDPEAKRLLMNAGGANYVVALYEGAFRRVPKTAPVERKMPAWTPVVMTAVLPGVWVGKWVARRRRRATGECVTCGYDLTGNVSGVCPECGVKVAGV